MSDNYQNQPKVASISPGFFGKLKMRWQLESNTQVFLVLLTFTLTGSTVAFLRKWIFLWFGFTPDTAWYIKTVTYILVVFPLYQVLILVYGSLLGQFAFFWNYEKKMINRFRRKRKQA